MFLIIILYIITLNVIIFNDKNKKLHIQHIFFRLNRPGTVDEASEFTLFPAEQINSQSNLGKPKSFFAEALRTGTLPPKFHTAISDQFVRAEKKRPPFSLYLSVYSEKSARALHYTYNGGDFMLSVFDSVIYKNVFPIVSIRRSKTGVYMCIISFHWSSYSATDISLFERI